MRVKLATTTPLLALGLLAAAASAAAAPLVPGPPVQVTDLRGGPVARSSEPSELATLGGWIYFSAEDPAHGRELWRTDGSSGGAERVADLCPGACSSDPRSLVALGARLLFIAGDHQGPELWATDGTEEGTVPLAPVTAGRPTRGSWSTERWLTSRQTGGRPGSSPG